MVNCMFLTAFHERAVRAPGRAVLLNVKLICRSVPIATCTKLGSKYVETVARRQGVSDCGVATVEFHATQCFL